MKKKILVTGSEGFIGSHLVERLVKNKYNVKAFVQYNSFNSIGWLSNIEKKYFKYIDIHFGDIRDQKNVDIALSDCKKVFNLAALIGIPYSYQATQSYIDTNISGTHNLLQSSLKFKIQKFIQTSTSEVYGTPKNVPITENHKLNAQSPYAASKVAADQMAFSFYKSFNLPVVIIRPFNTFGPRQSLRAIIPTIITQILNTNNKFIKLGNINTKRDFNYIDDIIDGFLLALNRKNIIGETINLGSGKEYKIKEIVKIVSKISNKKISIKIDKSRLRPKASEVQRLLASHKKAKELLGWKPNFEKRNNFEEAIKRTMKWFLNNKERYFLKDYNV
tara:strand:- start:8827 stop:9825 length:999 start_codon:yes stop_codon:yes gene_type:complete